MDICQFGKINFERHGIIINLICMYCWQISVFEFQWRLLSPVIVGMRLKIYCSFSGYRRMTLVIEQRRKYWNLLAFAHHVFQIKNHAIEQFCIELKFVCIRRITKIEPTLAQQYNHRYDANSETLLFCLQ